MILDVSISAQYFCPNEFWNGYKTDQSFIYYIRHNPTNTILLVGDYHGNK